MVTVPGGRPPTPIHFQLAESPTQTVSSSVSGSYSQSTLSPVGVPGSSFEPVWSSGSAASLPRNGGLTASSNENKNVNVKADFWRLSNNVGHFRPTKRPCTLASNQDDSCPQPKIHITEEKMLARLRNFHITSSSNNVDRGWFFMQKPVEMFDDIENRMSDDDEEDNKAFSPPRINVRANADSDFSNDDSHVSQERKKTLAISGVLRRILDADRKKRATVPAPSPCTDVVLWKPPGDFLKEIIPTPVANDDNASSSVGVGAVIRDQSFYRISDTDMSDMEFTDQRLSSSCPSPIDRDGYSESLLHQRRNARQYSRPIIEVLNLPTIIESRSVNSECESSNALDTMDIDE